jgi:acyl carrier protein
VTTTEFLRTLEQALEIDPGKITGQEALADTEWWDSMAALTFMAVADQELHVTISGAQLQQCKTVPQLLALLDGKLT